MTSDSPSHKPALEAKPKYQIIQLRDGVFAVKAIASSGPPVIVHGFRTEREAQAWIDGDRKRL
ncbi:MAG: hypothetical protein QOK29_755 [Rhodospirillaceae bacterium]|jgi:hypothetical protein|nr:hypothetical protein [Rhodospirillaceae bacterium]